MRLNLTPGDVLRLKALGVRVEPERPEQRCMATRDDLIIAALNDRIADLAKSERQAWTEVRRWRIWGWMGIACAVLGILAQILAAMARMGGW